MNCDWEGYRSGHNGAVLKTVRVKAHVGSNPTSSAKKPDCESNPVFTILRRIFMKNSITQWENQINGKNYLFSHKKSGSTHTVTYNGSQAVIKGGFMSAIIGFDEKFILDGKEARLVIEKNKPDIVVDGVYLQSGKQYIQRPAWVMVFAIICILIPIVSLGGALPVILGLGGAALCVSASKTSLPTITRVFLCTAVTLTAWLLWFFLIIGISLLL